MAAAVELVGNMLPKVKGEACEAGLKALHADASGRMTKVNYNQLDFTYLPTCTPLYFNHCACAACPTQPLCL